MKRNTQKGILRIWSALSCIAATVWMASVINQLAPDDSASGPFVFIAIASVTAYYVFKWILNSFVSDDDVDDDDESN